MDRLHNIIQEVVDSYLVESYSISDDVIRASNECLEKIRDAYENKNLEYDSLNIDNDKTIPFAIISLQKPINCVDSLSRIEHLTVYVFEFADTNEMRKYANIVGIGGDSNVNLESILVRCSSINGKLRDNQLLPILSHELEHIFQNIKGGLRSDYKNWYNIAVENLNGDKNSYEYIISRLIYYFNQQEIDASMHELMHDLIENKIENPNDIYKCNVIKEKNFYINNMYKTIINGNQDELNMVLKNMFNTTRERFFSYLSKQMHYFDKKVMRVVMEYFRRKQIIYKPKSIIPPR